MQITKISQYSGKGNTCEIDVTPEEWGELFGDAA